MNQTESLLLLGLGFAAALVVALVVGYLAWSATSGWTARQRRREIPSIILDLQAEREALRAQNAMTSRRLEFLLEEARNQAAEKSAEVTRHRNRSIMIARTIQSKDAEILKLKAFANELTDETNRRAKIIARLTGREAKKLRKVEFPAMNPMRSAATDMAGASVISASEEKVKNTIAELNALTAQIARQQEILDPAPPPDTEAPADAPAEATPLEAVLNGSVVEGDAIDIPADLTTISHADRQIDEATKVLETAIADLKAEIINRPETPPSSFDSLPPPPEKPQTLAEKFRALKSGLQN